MKLPYTFVTLWSEEDDCYLIHLPEFPSQKFHTHGHSYMEALENAREVLDLLVEEYQQEGKNLPKPKNVEQTLRVFSGPGNPPLTPPGQEIARDVASNVPTEE